MLDVALEKKIVQKAGSYFSFGDERLGQGRQNATAFLAENPDLVQQILQRIQAEAPEEQVISAWLLPTAAQEEKRVEIEEPAASKRRRPWRGRGHRTRSSSRPRAPRAGPSERELEERLEARGVSETARRGGDRDLQRTGLLDDRRFAEGRASALAGRGAGDALIRHELVGGCRRELVDEALASVDPELERALGRRPAREAA